MKTLQVLLLITSIVLGFSANATTLLVCGKRTGSFGNASLVNQDRVVLVLAEQGRSSELLDQMDDLLMEAGSEPTTVGRYYCAQVHFENGDPTQILSARQCSNSQDSDFQELDNASESF